MTRADPDKALSMFFAVPTPARGQCCCNCHPGPGLWDGCVTSLTGDNTDDHHSQTATSGIFRPLHSPWQLQQWVQSLPSFTGSVLARVVQGLAAPCGAASSAIEEDHR